MCILLNVKKHEKTFALNVDIFRTKIVDKKLKNILTIICSDDNINKLTARNGKQS